MISQCKYYYFLGKIAISITPFCRISPQQFSLSQYCMKHNSEKNLTDEKFIFNHKNASTVWINWFRIFANRATLNTRLSFLGFEDSNRMIGCRTVSIRNYFCLVKYNEVYVLEKKTQTYLYTWKQSYCNCRGESRTPKTYVMELVTVEVNLGPQ